MKRFKAVAILVMFAGIILLLQACTPKTARRRRSMPKKRFQGCLKRCTMPPNLRTQASIRNTFSTDCRMMLRFECIFAAGTRRRTHHVQSEQRLAAAAIRAVLKNTLHRADRMRNDTIRAKFQNMITQFGSKAGFIYLFA